MSVTPLLEIPVLLDYEQSNVAAADPGMPMGKRIELDMDCVSLILFVSNILPFNPLCNSPFGFLDSDIIEGPSRVSLNCPIRYSMVLATHNSVTMIILSRLFLFFYFYFFIYMNGSIVNLLILFSGIGEKRRKEKGKNIISDLLQLISSDIVQITG